MRTIIAMGVLAYFEVDTDASWLAEYTFALLIFLAFVADWRDAFKRHPNQEK